jgi:hypothetical protein
MSEWERNSTKEGSGSFNPSTPEVDTGSHIPTEKTGYVGESIRQGSTPGEWNPPSSGADVNGTSGGYNFPVGSAVGASMPWETNSSDRK